MKAREAVLVIDDDDDYRDSCVEVLMCAGFEVRGERNARNVLGYLSSAPRKPSVILLDLMMPDMNGWDFLEHRTRDPLLAPIPVVIMSASGRHAPEGIVGSRFLSKLAPPEELIATVQGVCAGRLTDAHLLI